MKDGGGFGTLLYGAWFANVYTASRTTSTWITSISLSSCFSTFSIALCAPLTTSVILFVSGSDVADVVRLSSL